MAPIIGERHHCNGVQAVKTAHAADKRARDLLKPISRRCGLDNSVDVEFVMRARHRYLTSLDVKVAHLQRLHNGMGREQLKCLAEQLDPYLPYRQPISFFEIARKGRLPRPVCMLPVALKATHRMAKDLLEAQTSAHETMYGRRGRGRDHLICDLRSTLEARSDAWLVLADVSDCFQSINPDSIYRLGLLPDQFVEAALDVRRMKFRKKDRLLGCRGPSRQAEEFRSPYPVITTSEHAGLRGLMQGSPASNSLLTVFFNDLHSRLPEGVTLFVQSDNIAVVCRSEVECSSVRQYLDDYVRRHQAGPLVPTFDFCGDAREGFEFLGYSFEWANERWLVRHSTKNLIKALRRLCYQCDDPDLTSDEALMSLLNGFGSTDDRAIEMFIRIIEEAF